MHRNISRRAVTLFTALAAAAFAASACEGPTSPVRGDLQLAFGNAEGDPIESRAGVVSAESGRIAVGGRIPTGNPCQDMRGESVVSGGALDFRIIARQRNTPCPAVIAVFPYIAAQHGLPSGSYRVRVHHAYENTGWSDVVVLDTTVVVP